MIFALLILAWFGFAVGFDAAHSLWWWAALNVSLVGYWSWAINRWHGRQLVKWWTYGHDCDHSADRPAATAEVDGKAIHDALLRYRRRQGL